MKKNYFGVEQKTITRLFINFLETSIADEVILSSFIRNVKILFSSDKEIHIGVQTTYAISFLKENYGRYFSFASVEILGKKLEPKFFESSKYKIDSLIENKQKVDVEKFFINPKYNFDNYVVDSFNEHAVRSSHLLIDEKGKYNPLYIFSKSGFGKTHLLHSIGNELIKKNKVVFYISPNHFTNEVKLCFENKRNNVELLKNKYSSADYLLVDDIQFFSNRKKTMEVFFDIFNKSIDLGNQIIIASDKTFNELGGFEERFITRFGKGLVLELKKPSLEGFEKIVKNKIKDFDVLSKKEWKPSAIKFLARNNNSNIRSIESSLTRVAFLITSFPENSIINEYVLKEIFKDVFIDEFSITPEKIVSEVAKYYAVSKHNIYGKRRNKEFVLARHVSMYFCRKINKYPFKKIGKIFGGRDHSTVINAINKIEFIIKNNKTTLTALSLIENKIRRMN